MRITRGHNNIQDYKGNHDTHLRSSLTYVHHKLKDMPRSSPARALNRLCAVGRSATPETAGAIRTKASSPTSFLFKANKQIIYINS